MKIAVAGIGYVGLSLSVLLAQRHEVVALDISEDRVARLNAGEAPIADPEIERYLAEESLTLRATTDAAEAFDCASYIVVATPTSYDPQTNRFDTSSVEAVIESALKLAPEVGLPLKDVMERGVHPYGMQTFEMALKEKVKQGLLSVDVARAALG